MAHLCTPVEDEDKSNCLDCTCPVRKELMEHAYFQLPFHSHTRVPTEWVTRHVTSYACTALDAITSQI